MGHDAPTWFRNGLLFFSSWLVLGAYSDTWAHHHTVLTSVVTPFHGFIFSGLICEGLFLAWSLRRLGATRTNFRESIPRGYGLAVAGYAMAMLAGPLDLSRHFFFGIDQGFGSVTSPTHILLGTGTTLIVTGPLREAWSSPDRSISWPALISGTLTVAMLTFFDEATHPFLAPWGSKVYPVMMLPESAEQIGTVEIVVWVLLISSCVLPLVGRFELPFGALTLLLGITGMLTTLIVAPQPVIVVGFVGGLCADELVRGLRPRDSSVRMRTFAFLVPVVMSGTYFGILSQAGGLWWPVNIWAGCVAAAGITGLLVSLLLGVNTAAPGLPAHADRRTEVSRREGRLGANAARGSSGSSRTRPLSRYRPDQETLRMSAPPTFDARPEQ